MLESKAILDVGTKTTGARGIDLTDLSGTCIVLDWSLRLQLPWRNHQILPWMPASEGIMLAVKWSHAWHPDVIWKCLGGVSGKWQDRRGKGVQSVFVGIVRLIAQWEARNRSNTGPEQRTDWCWVVISFPTHDQRLLWPCWLYVADVRVSILPSWA